MNEQKSPADGFEKSLALEKRCLSDLYKQFESQTLIGQQHKRYNVVEILGAITLAFHRGRQSGREERPHENEKD